MPGKRVVAMKVLPGEPLDGTGRLCAHFLVQDETSPFTEPHILHPVMENGVQVKQKVVAMPTRMRLACDPKRDFRPVTVNGVTHITLRYDNPEAVSCPKCKKTKEYAEAMKRIAALEKV